VVALSLDVVGIKQAIAKLDVLRRAYPLAAQAACYTAATEIMEKAVELVPVLTGETRASAFVMRSNPVKYGFAHWLSQILHEMPFKHAGGKQWKFLSTPLNDAMAGLPARLAELTERYALDKITIDDVEGVFPSTPRYDVRSRSTGKAGRLRGAIQVREHTGETREAARARAFEKVGAAREKKRGRIAAGLPALEPRVKRAGRRRGPR
jgi:hypothetical protein